MANTTLDWSGIPDAELIRELKSRGRLREFGAQRDVWMDGPDPTKPELKAYLQKDIALNLGQLLHGQGAITMSEHIDGFGKEHVTGVLYVLMPRAPVVPTKERA